MSPPSQMSERVRTLRLLSSSINSEFSEDSERNGGLDQTIDLHDIQNTLLNKVVERQAISFLYVSH